MRSEETQTLRAGCSKAKQKFRPAADLFPRARDGQNLISWGWSLPSPTNRVWLGSMHAISSYCGNRPTNTQTKKQTNKQTNKHTYRTDYNTLKRLASFETHSTRAPIRFHFAVLSLIRFSCTMQRV